MAVVVACFAKPAGDGAGTHAGIGEAARGLGARGRRDGGHREASGVGGVKHAEPKAPDAQLLDVLALGGCIPGDGMEQDGTEHGRPVAIVLREQSLTGVRFLRTVLPGMQENAPLHVNHMGHGGLVHSAMTKKIAPLSTHPFRNREGSDLRDPALRGSR